MTDYGDTDTPKPRLSVLSGDRIEAVKRVSIEETYRALKVKRSDNRTSREGEFGSN